jgi:biopolymer transport protein ExbD
MIPGAGLDREAEVMVDINTTPLVDVLLVLLVMLIITIPIQLHSVNIEMPGRQSAPAQPEVVQVDVTPAGGFLWNGEPLAGRAELESRLRKASAQPEQPEIHLRPHRAAKYDTVAAALAAAQRLGLAKIGLVGSEQFAP